MKQKTGIAASFHAWLYVSCVTDYITKANLTINAYSKSYVKTIFWSYIVPPLDAH